MRRNEDSYAHLLRALSYITRISVSLGLCTVMLLSSASAQAAPGCGRSDVIMIYTPRPPEGWMDRASWKAELRNVLLEAWYVDSFARPYNHFDSTRAIPPRLAAMWRDDSAAVEWGLWNVIVSDPLANYVEAYKAAEYFYLLRGRAARMLGELPGMVDPSRIALALQSIRSLQTSEESAFLVEYICDLVWLSKALEEEDPRTGLARSSPGVLFPGYNTRRLLVGAQDAILPAYRLLNADDQRRVRSVIEASVSFIFAARAGRREEFTSGATPVAGPTCGGSARAA